MHFCNGLIKTRCCLIPSWGGTWKMFFHLLVKIIQWGKAQLFQNNSAEAGRKNYYISNFSTYIHMLLPIFRASDITGKFSNIKYIGTIFLPLFELCLSSWLDAAGNPKRNAATRPSTSLTSITCQGMVGFGSTWHFLLTCLKSSLLTISASVCKSWHGVLSIHSFFPQLLSASHPLKS